MKTYIQIDDLGNKHGNYGMSQIEDTRQNPNYSRIRLIIDGVQVDGCDCPTSELLQALQLVQTRSYDMIVSKKKNGGK